MKKIYKTISIIVIVLILLIVLFKVLNVRNVVLSKIYPKKYQEYVEKYAKEYNVDPLLIFSIIKAESNFDKDAKSASKAKGLMQIMDSTAIEIANKIDEPILDETLFDPEKNIMIGTKYYSELLDLYNGNMLLALTAYNAGIGNVTNWITSGIIDENGSNIENIPYKETNMYVRKIIRNYKIYQQLENNTKE